MPGRSRGAGGVTMTKRTGFAAASLAAALCVAGLGAGCAYVTAQPVKPGDRINGIRIYDVKPLLVVSGESVSLQFVPNYNRAYALRFGAFLAKNDFQAAMSNGVLTSVHANMDTTAIIELLKTLADKIPVGPAGANAAARTAGGVKDRFQVYDIVFDDDGNLVALRPLLVEGQHHLLKTPPGGAARAAVGAQGLSGSTVIVQPGASVVLPQEGAGQAAPARPAQE